MKISKEFKTNIKNTIIICSLLALLVAVSIIIAVGKEIKNNKLYTANENNTEKDLKSIYNSIETEGINPFIEFNQDKFGVNSNAIVIAISRDKKSVFYVEPSDMAKASSEKVVVGEDTPLVNLYRKDMSTGAACNIAREISFIEEEKWNPAGDKIAFLTNNNLIMYDLKSNKAVINDQTGDSKIMHIGWDKEGTKIYTEQIDAANGLIYYVNSQKTSEAYQTNETMYVKGILDDKYCYCTGMGENGTDKGSLKYYTFITDKSGNIVKRFDEGRYRDSYKKELLESGKNNFGLTYVPDVNKQDKAIKLTEEYVYDAKFCIGGKLVYTTSYIENGENNFILHIVNNSGKELKATEVSGANLQVSLDGKTCYIGGRLHEIVDLNEGTVLSKLKIDATDKASLEAAENEIFKTIRGALSIFYIESNRKSSSLSSLKESQLKKANEYFTDSKDTGLWAHYDIEKIINNQMISLPDKSKYKINVYSERLNMREASKSAEEILLFEVRDSSGKVYKKTVEFELKNINAKWYIAGISTFSDSAEAKAMTGRITNICSKLTAGEISNGEYKDSQITVGQLQFYDSLNLYGVLSDIRKANYCSAYLNIEKNGIKGVYKLIMQRENGNWGFVKLDKVD